MLTSRKDFAKIINDKQYKIAVEIGVGHGAYSEFLLSSCQNIILYSVDPWDSSLHEFRPGSKENTITKLQKFEDRSKILNMKSNEAIKILFILTVVMNMKMSKMILNYGGIKLIMVG